MTKYIDLRDPQALAAELRAKEANGETLTENERRFLDNLQK